MTERMTIGAAMRAIEASDDDHYGVLLSHGTLELGCYAPRDTDPQQPHDQDEIYIVHSGHGSFELDGKRQPFEAGEALFVPAGVSHRFVDFSDNFHAWVVFYGPRGGEHG